MGVSINKQKDIDGDKIIIEGGTDGTSIGNIDDSLKVTSSSTSSVPKDIVVFKNEFVTNGGSFSMDVNGSSTAQEFIWQPGSGETWYINRLHFYIEDTGSMGRTEFGSLPGLGNGVLVEVKTDGTTYEIANMTNNIEVLCAFPISRPLVSGGSFLEPNNTYYGSIEFSPRMTIKDSTSDFVKVTVRDNLTGLDEMTLCINKWRIP